MMDASQGLGWGARKEDRTVLLDFGVGGLATERGRQVVVEGAAPSLMKVDTDRKPLISAQLYNQVRMPLALRTPADAALSWPRRHVPFTLVRRSKASRSEAKWIRGLDDED